MLLLCSFNSLSSQNLSLTPCVAHSSMLHSLLTRQLLKAVLSIRKWRHVLEWALLISLSWVPAFPGNWLAKSLLDSQGMWELGSMLPNMWTRIPYDDRQWEECCFIGSYQTICSLIFLHFIWGNHSWNYSFFKEAFPCRQLQGQVQGEGHAGDGFCFSLHAGFTLWISYALVRWYYAIWPSSVGPCTVFDANSIDPSQRISDETW